MADEDPHRAYGQYSAYMTEEERREWERLLKEYDAEVAATAAAAAARGVDDETEGKGKGKAVASDAAGWMTGEAQEKGKEVSRRRKDAVDQQKRAKYHREKNEYVRLVVTQKEPELLKNSGAMGVPDVQGAGLERQQSIIARHRALERLFRPFIREAEREYDRLDIESRRVRLQRLREEQFKPHTRQTHSSVPHAGPSKLKWGGEKREARMERQLHRTLRAATWGGSSENLVRQKMESMRRNDPAYAKRGEQSSTPKGETTKEMGTPRLERQFAFREGESSSQQSPYAPLEGRGQMGEMWSTRGFEQLRSEFEVEDVERKFGGLSVNKGKEVETKNGEEAEMEDAEL